MIRNYYKYTNCLGFLFDKNEDSEQLRKILDECK